MNGSFDNWILGNPFRNISRMLIDTFLFQSTTQIHFHLLYLFLCQVPLFLSSNVVEIGFFLGLTLNRRSEKCNKKWSQISHHMGIKIALQHFKIVIC